MTTRINAKRQQQASPSGLKRVVLAEAVKAEELHSQKWLRTPTKPKARVLVIAHSVKNSLDDHALQTIAAAAILADAETAVFALVLGELNDDLSNAGADEVMVLPTLDFQVFQPEVELGFVEAVIADIKPTRIFMPENCIGDGDLGRRLIAQTQQTAATQVVEIDAYHLASKQAGGGILAQSALPEIILLAPNAVDVNLPFTGAAKRIVASLPKTVAGNYQDLYQNMGLQSGAAEDIALEESDFIVSAGNGVQNLATLTILANALNASIGASRVVVDDGKLPRDKQIGATGKTVSASTYFAIGISGAVQHLQGIKDCRHVIAINKDASAPIVKRADLSIIGDAEEIMQGLIAEIAAAKAGTK
jgi:electron transfer flavoprotein alpha subunit